MRLQTLTDKRLAGFSLIQVSIILAVAAVILVTALPSRQAGDYNQRSAETNRKLQKIEEAMRGFMALNGRRPCPADPQYLATGDTSKNSQYFGVEAATPGTCTGGTPSAPLSKSVSTGISVVGGVIPTRTLGLSDDYAVDGWGRRFTYVVDARATKSTSCYAMQKSISYRTGSGALHIKDSNGNLRDNTMYAYISYGASGDGAWPAQSATRINTGATDPGMVANAASNPAFTNSLYQEEKSSTFDDILYYSGALKNTCCLSGVCSTQTNVTIGGDGQSNDGDTAGNKDVDGFTLAIGDVNGDGYPDLILGAPNFNAGAGAVYVIFGQSGPFPDPLPLNYNAANTYINGTNGFRIDGAAGSFTGFSVAAGDFNGDGIADIIIGAPVCNGTGGTCSGTSGKVFVVNGRSTWSSNDYSLASLVSGGTAFSITNNDANAGFGTAVAAGDLTKDGYADILVGSSFDGSVYAVYGSASPSSISGLSGLAASSTGFVIQNAFSNTQPVFGTPLAIGDLLGHGDGTNDIVIAAPDAVNAANVSVIFGQGSKANWNSDMTSSVMDVTAVPLKASGTSSKNKGVTLSGVQVSSVAIGNVTGNSTNDLVLASPNVGNIDGVITGTGAVNSVPRVYVVKGTNTAWASNNNPMALTQSTVDGTHARADALFTGIAMDGAYVPWMSLALGDVTGDGTADILFGEPYASTLSCNHAGYAYLAYGGGLPAASSPVDATLLTPSTSPVGGFHVHGINVSDVFASGVAIGNITDNTTGDLIIGAPMTSYPYSASPANNFGETYIIQGGTANFPASGNYHLTLY